MAGKRRNKFSNPWKTMQTRDTDFLVIGSGLAGLTAALRLSAHGQVLVASKCTADEGNTRYAQGGVACVVDPSDSMEEHIADETLRPVLWLLHELGHNLLSDPLLM